MNRSRGAGSAPDVIYETHRVLCVHLLLFKMYWDSVFKLMQAIKRHACLHLSKSIDGKWLNARKC